MHTMITGMTGTGKSTIAEGIAESAKKRGMEILVLDPFNDRRFSSLTKHVYTDSFEFYDVVMMSRNCCVIVDECGHTLQKNPEFDSLATMTRKYGHLMVFCMQRYVQASVTLRDQCSKLYAFRQSATDCKHLVAQYGDEILANCSTLKVGYFYEKISVDSPAKLQKIQGCENWK